MAQASEMANTCQLNPDLVLCSPAVRTWSTAICYFQQLNWDYQRLKIIPPLYEASLDTLIVELQNIDECNETVFVFGHNPGINLLIEFLIPCEQAMPNLVTSGRVVIELDLLKWQGIGSQSGSIVEWHTPADFEP